MSENDTLLAHLAPRIAGGSENAAVEALAYILNKTESTAAAFNDLVSVAAGLAVERCTVFRTQVTAEDNSRPILSPPLKPGSTERTCGISVLKR